ncbi:MAG TPA: hypothetical protein VMV69_12475 [Pirellulales bacterium]|nr:hypothetical protein [Pirellulales bacterium]
MTHKVRGNRRQPSAEADTVESLYLELLRSFYEKGDLDRARSDAMRLDEALANRPDVAGSIRGEEIRSLLAELRGELAEAIQHRETEIRKILELHSLAVNTQGWQYVLRQYDFSDVGDRLDLLAILYDEQGDLDRAVQTLRESKQFCESHEVPFDGQDLLTEFEQARRAARNDVENHAAPRKMLDDAVRAVFRQSRASVDEILVNDEQARSFVEQVNRRLAGQFHVSPREIKRRLLVLQRRGEARGGLPRVRRG